MEGDRARERERESERARESEREIVCVFVHVMVPKDIDRMCATNDPCPFTGVHERERARARQRERECVCVCVCVRARVSLYIHSGVEGSRQNYMCYQLKLYVSFAKEPYKRDAILQKNMCYQLSLPSLVCTTERACACK